MNDPEKKKIDPSIIVAIITFVVAAISAGLIFWSEMEAFKESIQIQIPKEPFVDKWFRERDMRFQDSINRVERLENEIIHRK